MIPESANVLALVYIIQMVNIDVTNKLIFKHTQKSKSMQTSASKISRVQSLLKQMHQYGHPVTLSTAAALSPKNTHIQTIYTL